ncbi:MAG: hypothetical protein ACR2MA_01410 [Egibacteraceae bacterium]|jgi:LmbE family N-acetylglucosaminyl deacetylase
MTVTTRVASRLWPRLRRLRNRRFASDLAIDPSAPPAVLSPHFDDAVIDCWSVLTRPEDVRVVNVFGGSPKTGCVAYWDRVSGALDSAARVRERISEDREALDHAGRTPTNLDFLGIAYRAARSEPSFGELDAALASSITAVSKLYAPAAMGSVHPDHELIRAYALAMADQGFAVTLYADVPYCVGHGWPSWVTGIPQDPYLDVDQAWSASLAAFSDRCHGRPHVLRLDRDAAARKLAAMRTYRSQFAMLDRGPIGLLSNPLIHRFEVFWPLR